MVPSRSGDVDGPPRQTDRGVAPSDPGSDFADDDGPLDGIGRRAREAVGQWFGIDTRGLAAFRIALGLLVVADLVFRARELRTFYTDAGVLPRGAHAEFFPTLARLSVHTLPGSTVGQALLFVAAGVLASALVAGYRTRLATFVTAGLHASMYARNPALMNGGDALLVLALFLGIFLPLGERWSVDALRSSDGRGSRRTRVVSLATATVLLQLVVVYLANASFKVQSDAWTSGTAFQTVLELEQFSVFLGPHLTAYPSLLAAVGWLWMAMLVVSPLLVLATGRTRTAVVTAFVGAHFGMLATMRLGFFPLVVVALLLLYLPRSVWDRVERFAVDSRETPGRLRRVLDDRLTSAQEPRIPPLVREAGRVGAALVLAVVLVVSIAWPITAVGVVDTTQYDSVPDPDGYTWTLFAPNPPSSTRWFVAPASVADGEAIDALDGSSIDGRPPEDAADAYPSTLWHRYLADVRWADDGRRAYLAAHLCERAGRFTDGTVTDVTLYVVERPVESVGGGEARRTELISHDCSTATY